MVVEVDVEKVMYSAQRCSNVYWSTWMPQIRGLGSSLARESEAATWMHESDHLSPSHYYLYFYPYFSHAYTLLIHIPAQHGSQKHNHQAYSYTLAHPFLPPRPPLTTRVVKEAAEITTNPTPDLYAAPLEENLFEWHFTIRGAPEPSPFAGGVYHGRIILPPAYPLRPPSFRFLTPSGRFEPNREICLSISGHHEETWQPAWGIRTALVAIRSFMDTDAGGQVGGMSAPDNVRKALAEKSRGYSCAGCGKAALAILEEQEQRCKELGVEATDEEENPLVGKIGLIEPKKDANTAEASAPPPATPQSEDVVAGSEPELSTVATDREVQPAHTPQPQPQSQNPAVTRAQTQPQAQPPTQPQQLPLQPVPVTTTTDAWIDKAIIGIVIALVLMILRRAA
jgi:ubiquitin-conjugating enzyme E2 J1